MPAAALIWATLAASLLRDGAFHAVEALVRSPARRALGIRQPFSDDTVAYFTERLDVPTTRAALVTAVRQAKRRKGFDEVVRIGLVLDGTTVGRCPTVRCPWCHPVIVPHTTEAGERSAVGLVVGQHHELSLLSVVGGVLQLPVDLEPYGPGDRELAASLRVRDRGCAHPRPRVVPSVASPVARPPRPAGPRVPRRQSPRHPPVARAPQHLAGRLRLSCQRRVPKELGRVGAWTPSGAAKVE